MICKAKAHVYLLCFCDTSEWHSRSLWSLILQSLCQEAKTPLFKLLKASEEIESLSRSQSAEDKLLRSGGVDFEFTGSVNLLSVDGFSDLLYEDEHGKFLSNRGIYFSSTGLERY